MSSPSPKTSVIEALAVDGAVVLLAGGPGRPVEGSFEPQAILDSLESMRLAANEALHQRRLKASLDEAAA